MNEPIEKCLSVHLPSDESLKRSMFEIFPGECRYSMEMSLKKKDLIYSMLFLYQNSDIYGMSDDAVDYSKNLRRYLLFQKNLM
jgi:hypothetical protein